MSTVTDEGILGNTERQDIKELESVTILFAGDSGDGMQLTGTQFTDASVFLGNDISTLPRLSGRDPRARRAPSRACRRISCTSPARTSSTPGDDMDVLGGDERRGPEEVNLRELKEGRHRHRRQGRLRREGPRKGQLRRQSLGGRLAGRVPRHAPSTSPAQTMRCGGSPAA
jgi:hypothetical protein